MKGCDPSLWDGRVSEDSKCGFRLPVSTYETNPLSS